MLHSGKWLVEKNDEDVKVTLGKQVLVDREVFL